MRARIAGRWTAIQQEGDGRVAGKFLPVDMQDSAICACQRAASLVIAGNVDKRLRTCEEIGGGGKAAARYYHDGCYDDNDGLEA